MSKTGTIYRSGWMYFLLSFFVKKGGKVTRQELIKKYIKMMSSAYTVDHAKLKLGDHLIDAMSRGFIQRVDRGVYEITEKGFSAVELAVKE